MRLELDNTNPIAWGMPFETAAFFAECPAFAVPEGLLATTVAS